MSRLDVPSLSRTQDAASVTAWLNLCVDSFEAWTAMNPEKTLKPGTMILLAGIKMECPDAAQWWNENREELKKLAAWSDFSNRVRERFVPANWRMGALESFYLVKQGGNTFLEFVSKLQAARNSLGSAGKGFTINDSVFKNHLLFFCHPILSLRVRALPSLGFENLAVDKLIGIMSSSWESMIAEGVAGNTRSSTAGFGRASASVIAPPVDTTRSGLPDLSASDREALRSAGGCFHCRLTPASLGWTPHQSRNCPGDKSRNIPPRGPASARNPVGAVLPGGAQDEDSDLSEDLDTRIAVFPPTQNFVSAVLPQDLDDSEEDSVFPSCVLEGDSDSDSNLSR